jgi:pyruvate/2-oxoglutarate dehydrogenase complex dihydrolipoamide acyltransferase (E2) component
MPRTPIRVPKLGMDTTEALLGQWFVAEGDAITPGMPLVELESEKVVFAYEAELTGKLVEIVVPHGQQVQMGEIIAYVDTD